MLLYSMQGENLGAVELMKVLSVAVMTEGNSVMGFKKGVKSKIAGK